MAIRTTPSAYAVQTFNQRKDDYEGSQGRVRTGVGGQFSSLSLEGQINLAAFIKKGNGWFDSNNAASTWVSKYGYWAQGGQGGLAIQFHDGAICWYPTLSDYSWYVSMQGAASKGRFIHEFIYKKVGYILVSN